MMATTVGSPKSVTNWSASDEGPVACRSAHRATLLSSRIRSAFPRTRYASTPSTRPPATVTSSASVSASPVALSGSSRRASLERHLGWRAATSPARSAVAMDIDALRCEMRG